MNRKKLLVIAVAVLVAAGIAAVGAGFGRNSSTPDAASSRANPPGFVGFQDPQAGFAIAYPAAWQRIPSSDPQVPLLVAQSAANSFQIRVVELALPVGPPDLAMVKQLTDQIVNTGASVKLLAQPKEIQLAGLSGYFYLYSFLDPSSGLTGVHSHYFLFRGKTLISMVFQAVPLNQFQSLAPTFDQISSSFRVF